MSKTVDNHIKWIEQMVARKLVEEIELDLAKYDTDDIEITWEELNNE